MAYQFNYGGIVKKSWRIAWKKRYLWIWGFILNVFAFLKVVQYTYSGEVDPEVSSIGRLINDWVISNREEVEALAAILFIVGVVFIFFMIVSKGALIGAAVMEVSGKKFSKGNFLGSLKLGLKSIGKVVGVWLIVTLSSLLIGLILLIPSIFLFYRGANVRGAVLGFMGGIIFLIYFVLIYFVQKIAYVLAVAERVGIFKSLVLGYKIVTSRFLNTLVLSIWILITKFIFLAITLGAILLLALIFLAIGAILYLVWQGSGVVVAVILAILATWFIATFISAIFRVFQEMVWVSWYIELRKERISNFLSKVKLT